jgi:hypothetical protein
MISFKSLLDFFVNFTFSMDSGGGGSAAPTNTTVQNTNLPEYAQPYVESMLGAAQKQMFNMDDSGAITGFKPYTPYSTNMQDYVAGFSPMQQQSFQGAQSLQLPDQYNQGSQMAAGSGMGSMYTAGQAGQAGNRYNSMATNPYATQAFMNPYLQASLDPQLNEIRRQYGITGTQEQSDATKQGAFGGSREALMASENNRNMGTAMNQAIGTGYNNAFNAAQQAQQFGANIGLQGQQAALQGYGQATNAANALGQLGQQQLAGQQGILGLQNQYGGQQQAQQQPMQNLANLSGLLHGLPLQNTTTQSYQAAPSGVSQLAGIGTGLLGASKLAAKGGVMKSYAGGGITSLENRQRIAENYSPQMLQQSVQHGVIPESMGTALSQDYANQQQSAQNMPQQSQGVTALPSNLPVNGMAQGGIIAFDNGGEVERFANKGAVKADPSGWDYTPVAPDYTQADAMIAAAQKAPNTMEDIVAARQAEEGKRGIADIYTPMLAKLQEKQAGLEGKRSNAQGLALLDAAGKMMSSTSPYAGAGIGAGISAGVANYGAATKDLDTLEENYAQQGNTIAMAQNAYKEAALSNDTNRMDKAKATIIAAQQNKQAIEATFRAQQDAGMLKGAEARSHRKEAIDVATINANKPEKPTDLRWLTEVNFKDLVENKGMPANAATQSAAANLATQQIGLMGPKLTQAAAEHQTTADIALEGKINDAKKADALIGDKGRLKMDLISAMGDPKATADIQKQIDARAAIVEANVRKGVGSKPEAKPAEASNPGKDKVQSKPTPSPTPSTVAYMTNPATGKSEPMVVKGGKWVWQKSGKAVD